VPGPYAEFVTLALPVPPSLVVPTRVPGPVQLAAAIEEARATMLDAPWLCDSSDPLRETAAAETQLKHQITAALDQGFVFHDPMHPEFRELDAHNQFGLVNPDNRYLIARISTPGTYVIRGKRGTSADLQIQVGSGNPGFDGKINITPISQLTRPDLVVDDDGCFEIVVSSTPAGDNWLSNTDGSEGATNIIIRESFMDWTTEVGSTWYIERVDTRGVPSPVPDPIRVDERYARAAAYLATSTATWVDYVTALREKAPPNFLAPPAPATDGLPGQFNAAGLFDIGPEQAVIIRLTKSRARYQSIQVGDLWFNSFDYRRRQTSLNLAQARRSSDDDYWFVISHEDPGVPNWLDPSGASTTVVFARWQGLRPNYCFRPCELPTAKVVDFADVRAELPDGEPYVCPTDRAEQLAARKAASLVNPRRF